MKLEDLAYYEEYDEICEDIENGTISNVDLEEYIKGLLDILIDYKYKYKEIQKDYSLLIEKLESSLGVNIINKHSNNESKSY